MNNQKNSSFHSDRRTIKTVSHTQGRLQLELELVLFGIVEELIDHTRKPHPALRTSRSCQVKATGAELPMLAMLLKVEPRVYIVVVLIRRFENTIR